MAENKKLYPDQKKEKAEMMELLTAKHNAERILGLSEEEKRREQRKEEWRSLDNPLSPPQGQQAPKAA